jgi:hypothetical protein
MACKARETCDRCLWLWPLLKDLHGSRRVCYCDHSVHYHHERIRADAACATFEYGVASNGVSYRFEERRNRPAKRR